MESWGMTGKKHTLESKKKMSMAHKGMHLSLKTQFKKGLTPWNKGLKGYMSGSKNVNYKKVFTKEEKENLRNKLLGWKPTPEQRLKNSLSHQGEKAYQWKNGASERHKNIRKSLEYRLWRESVFARDNWTCVKCNKKGGKLHADHIKPFSLYPKLRLAIDNGRTLCINCHKETETYGYKYIKIYKMYV